MAEEKHYGPLNVLSQAEVARVLNLGVSSVQRLRRQKEAAFPPRRSFGALKGWLYRDIEKWATSRPVDEGDEEIDEAS